MLLGRWNRDGQLRHVGRAATLHPVLARYPTGRLTPARAGHPWTGWTFSAGRGSRETVDVRPVEPEAVPEVSADTARDSTGRWRHPVRAHPARAHPVRAHPARAHPVRAHPARAHRIRTDLTPGDPPPAPAWRRAARAQRGGGSRCGRSAVPRSFFAGSGPAFTPPRTERRS
ncbi:hypothetical protein [Kitasatospora griseola]|uniref:hypothetical protein n=1 Tax=Kitasatospora griseola TaxID=2064 RepID=UPI00366415D3